MKLPLIRQINYWALIPHAIIMLGLIFLIRQYDQKNAGLYAAICYLIVFMLLRNLIPSSHRKGMVALQKGEFLQAITHFEKSYHLFKEKDWLDNYRSIFILSASAISYKEMALLNIAFAYGQMEDNSKCKEAYNRVLQEFPDSVMANAAIKMFNKKSPQKTEGIS